MFSAQSSFSSAFALAVSFLFLVVIHVVYPQSGSMAAPTKACSVSFNTNAFRASDFRLIGGYNDVLGTVENLTYFDTGLLLSSQMLYNGILRYPGGTVANYWSFQNASYVIPCSTSNYNYCKEQRVIEGLPPQTFSPANFSNGIGFASVLFKDNITNKANAVVYDVNLLTLNGSVLLNELNVLANEIGVQNVKYIELGNEYYLSNHYAWAFPNSTVYMEKAMPVMNQIREQFPNARIAVCSSRRSGDSSQSNSAWNNQIAQTKFDSSFDSVTVHDYSVKNSMQSDLNIQEQNSFLSIYGRSVIPQYVEYVQSQFGKDKTIWMTEYNSNIDNATFSYSVLHAMFVLSYVTAAICDNTNTMELLNLHLYSVQNGNSWGDNEYVTSLSATENDLSGTTFNVVGQILAQLGYISMVESNQMTCLQFKPESNDSKSSECPLLGITVASNANLQCLYGSGFNHDNKPDSFAFVIVNACAGASIDLELQLSTMTMGGRPIGADIVLNTYEYASDANGGAKNAKFINCDQNENVWHESCAAVKPDVKQIPISAKQEALSMSINPMSVVLAVTASAAE